MSDHIDLGKEGEDFALEFLVRKGWQLLDRNFRFQKAEVDLIFEHQAEIIFVEVKARESDYLSDPRLMITKSKQKQIIKAADYFLKLREIDLPARFDVVTIIINKKERTINHIANAFTTVG